jgi:hypothetical protein
VAEYCSGNWVCLEVVVDDDPVFFGSKKSSNHPLSDPLLRRCLDTISVSMCAGGDDDLGIL